jgi:hypothetical protein
MTVPGQVHDITGSMTSPSVTASHAPACAFGATDVTPLQDRIHGGVT